jgi:hypothetical protein
MVDQSLQAELETLAVRELTLEWADINHGLFGRALTAPQIVLFESMTQLGRWDSATRTLELSRALVFEKPWGVTVEVIKHETAHQYVHEVLGVTHEPPHGPAFQKVCEERGIDAAAAGMPSASGANTGREARVLQRVARLLALAESPNQYEAETAAAQAQRLMLKHNLEHVRDATRRRYGFLHLGRASGRLSAADHLLATILAKHFFVDVIWVTVYRPLEGKHGRVLEVCGTAENLAIASYVHQFLEHTGARLWREHKRAHRLRTDRDRRTFLAGVMSGFAEKLAGQARAHRAEGLVWVKDADLDGYFRARHPRIRGARGASIALNDAFRQGQRAGQEIVLHRGIEAGVEQRGLRLPARRAF